MDGHYNDHTIADGQIVKILFYHLNNHLMAYTTWITHWISLLILLHLYFFFVVWVLYRKKTTGRKKKRDEPQPVAEEAGMASAGK